MRYYVKIWGDTHTGYHFEVSTASVQDDTDPRHKGEKVTVTKILYKGSAQALAEAVQNVQNWIS